MKHTCKNNSSLFLVQYRMWSIIWQFSFGTSWTIYLLRQVLEITETLGGFSFIFFFFGPFYFLHWKLLNLQSLMFISHWNVHYCIDKYLMMLEFSGYSLICFFYKVFYNLVNALWSTEQEKNKLKPKTFH